MRKILLLCGLAVFLSFGVAYTVNVSDARVDPQDDWPSTPEGWVKLYEDRAKFCAQEAYDLNRGMQGTREADLGGSQTLSLHYADLKRDYKEMCFHYHYWLSELQKARARIPTPTPTLTPITTAPTSDPSPKPTSPSSETETKSVQPRDETNDKHIKFIKDQEQKLLELRDRKNKLIKDSNDYLKKAKSAKPKQPQPGFKVQTDSNGGLFTTTFTTPQGRILVHLPADMRAGDTISGTVVGEPNGKTEEECAKNLKALSSYQLAVANQNVGRYELTQPPATLPLTYCKTPTRVIYLIGVGFGPYKNSSAQETQQIPVGLKDPARNIEVANTTIPVSTAPSNVTGPQTPTQNDFNLPTTGQNGSSVEIKGPFDGDSRTTSLTIGGQPVIKLAESPRSCILKSPEQTFGPAEITLKENNVETKGTYRSLGVQLNAPKTSLLKGETTTVTIEVSGLSGIKHDVPLHLEASGVINMAGSNYQYLSIRPQDVKPDGRYTTTRAITGQQAGGFGVTATVFQRTHFIPLTENAAVNGVRVKKVGNSFLFIIENVKDPLKGDPLEGPYEVDYTCLISTKLSRVLASFKRGNAEAPMHCPEGRYAFARVALDF